MTKLDISSPGLTKALARQIGNDIDQHCVDIYDDGHRNHLGASLIGDPCARKLWYVFRWVKHEKHPGQLYRLFNRGHKEEDRFIEWMEGIGIEVWADDLENWKLLFHPESDSYIIEPTSSEPDPLCIDVSDDPHHIARAKADGIAFPQYRISDVMGHFGGSLDGICRLPERYGIEQPLLQEFKTSNTSGFNKLKKQGVILAKPQHHAQMSTYGNKYKLEYGLYMCVCKETDEIYYEVVKLDWELGQQMIDKAGSIICSQVAPPKMSQSETFQLCKWCAFTLICHRGNLCEKNCRSCKHAIPIDNAQWRCENWGAIIPKSDIANACPEYKSITDRV
jgi:hypothetical protein